MIQAATRVAFILSTRRAGSTWLNAVLGSHSWAAALGEYEKVFSIPGHIACRLCEADGRAECSVLHGVEHVAQPDAFAFAAQRIPNRVLVDATKHPRWCNEFLGRDDLDVRIIHLVRHPAGVIEGNGRRDTHRSYDDLLAEWETTNAFIEAFTARCGVPHLLTSYEQLTDEPERAFPRLCTFLGGAFEPDTLRYWKTPHHGLGANGASSLYLRGRSRTVYVTGDDRYYDALASTPTCADTRWKERLPAAVVQHALTSPYAAALARRLGRPWDDGRPAYQDVG